jgi:hypothetical protein
MQPDVPSEIEKEKRGDKRGVRPMREAGVSRPDFRDATAGKRASLDKRATPSGRGGKGTQMDFSKPEQQSSLASSSPFAKLLELRPLLERGAKDRS